MDYRYKLQHTIFNRPQSQNKTPVVTIQSTGWAHGSCAWPQLLSADPTVTATAYRLTKPTSSAEPRYSLILPELVAIYPDALTYTITERSDDYWQLNWKFDATAVSAVHKYYYGLFFAINAVNTAVTPQAMPDIIVYISDTAGFV